MQRCLFCGGDPSEPDHLALCDGRQGRLEAELYARGSDPDTSHEAAAAYDAERLASGIKHAVWLHQVRGAMADFEYRAAWIDTWRKPCCDHLYQQARSSARDQGLIRDSGERRVNPTTGRRQIVWEACDIGALQIDRCPECGGLRRRELTPSASTGSAAP